MMFGDKENPLINVVSTLDGVAEHSLNELP
jgi:hypothetical protein